RSARTIEEEARSFGAQGRFTILSNQSFTNVAEAFCRARASVVLSRREGSCVVMAESMFADTPVAILEGAELGSRVFINDRTGCFLRESRLAEDLSEFVTRTSRYAPRAWAEEHISCDVSSRLLNAMLKEDALRRGMTWTEDISPLEWCPDPTLVRADDRARL